jgi:mono/diheme cytochrome c family protein
MTRIGRFVLLLFVVVMVVALVGWAQTGEKAGANKGGGKGNAKEGETVFAGKCATCHAKDGSGSTPVGKNLKVRDLRSDEVQKQTDAQLLDIISKGKGKMQGYEKSLGADKIQDAVAYIRTLKK